MCVPFGTEEIPCQKSYLRINIVKCNVKKSANAKIISACYCNEITHHYVYIQVNLLRVEKIKKMEDFRK